MSNLLKLVAERWSEQHWIKKTVQILSAIGGIAMAVAAATSASDHHIQSDGTKAPPDRTLDGDPGAMPVGDVGKKKDGGEKSDPDSASNDLDESGMAAR